MSVLLIVVELDQKDQGAIMEIERYIGNDDSSMRIGSGVWLLDTHKAPAQVLNSLETYIDSDDNVFIFRLDKDWEASASFDYHVWLESRL